MKMIASKMKNHKFHLTLAAAMLASISTGASAVERNEAADSLDHNASALVYYNQTTAARNKFKTTGFHLKDKKCETPEKNPSIIFYRTGLDPVSKVNGVGCRGGYHGDLWFGDDISFNGIFLVCNGGGSCKKTDLR